ncbi:MAG: hypothetical protein NTY64_07755 [Deltaproteobacteria bacterium]|nr:hypothetical protein [Deltaproteobacteria bacterium]
MAAKKRILVTEDITGAGIDRLKDKYEVQAEPDLWKKIPQLEAAIQGTDALIVRNQTKVNDALLWKGKALQVVGRAGAGYDNIDLKKTPFPWPNMYSASFWPWPGRSRARTAP